MKDIASIIKLDCNEEIDIRYFTKNGSISDTTCDYGELLEYINSLEEIRDKAIEYIKHSWWLRNDQVYDTSKDLKGWEVEELLKILKGGE